MARKQKQEESKLTLNLAHLLFLHGMVKKLYETKGLENNMSNFLHDLLIMLEIYTDTVDIDPTLYKKFNYQPLNTENYEKKKELSENSKKSV